MLIEGTVLTVTDVNNQIKHLLEGNESLKYLFIKGEISNMKRQESTGHLYFTLKDNSSMLSMVMFNSYASKLLAVPNNGDEVIVMGSISAYAPRGTYSLTVYEMENVGLGRQYIELEKLKKLLASEGLFDISRKRPINLYPRAIGVITAQNSAAIKDIVTNLTRRYPLVDIYFFPSSVQGENAPKELLKAFYESQNYNLDTLIIGRGGGASEDLSAFNDEKLVRAIASSKMPVISAVGHEIDSTLVDYVADKRASTPTGAAELATIDTREIKQSFMDLEERMVNAINNDLSFIKDKTQDINANLNKCLNNMIDKFKLEIKSKDERLTAINPTNVLKRGYSITLDKDGKAISSKDDLKINDQLVTVFKDGKVISEVKEIK